MNQKRVRRRSQSSSQFNQPVQPASRPQQDAPPRERRNLEWGERWSPDFTRSPLASLIEQDAPLRSNNTLVLMYDPFQAEMAADSQGVASWLRDCIRKHGIPSLIRFDYRQKAQIFRRDQFQSWLEPLLNKTAS
ncbi:hypothetical protein JOY44_12515 [Phormidium sp. CLA17]|uniref:hypothetical protein n=1 Tax=Leptolyngbya sp. Cla-17 TaxID=2803751 RepID=UPI00149327A4|nr:hypothetical protein [Leptolyngbya sp. Cla-17]MBM0742429.1 hypothetical protein [Leptolyngbya sp. Cla-17]